MGDIFFVVVIATSVWILFDTKAIGVKKGQLSGFVDLGPWGWFICSLLLWIVVFPLYLAKRPVYKRINQPQVSR